MYDIALHEGNIVRKVEQEWKYMSPFKTKILTFALRGKLDSMMSLFHLVLQRKVALSNNREQVQARYHINAAIALFTFSQK